MISKGRCGTCWPNFNSMKHSQIIDYLGGGASWQSRGWSSSEADISGSSERGNKALNIDEKLICTKN